MQRRFFLPPLRDELVEGTGLENVARQNVGAYFTAFLYNTYAEIR
jgi:hypothetical protein